MKYRLLTLFIALLFCSNTVVAQEFWGNNRLYDYYLSKGNTEDHILQRISVGFGKHFLTGKLHNTYTNYDVYPISDTFIENSFRLKKSFAGHFGTFFPIILLNDNTMLTFCTELYLSYGIMSFDTLQISENAKYAAEYSFYKVGIPLSVEYKTGADVPLSRLGKQMLTFGGGIMLTHNSFFGGQEQFPIALVPFLKAEVGFYLGVAMKLRGTVFFGSADLVNDEQASIASYDNGSTANDILETKNSSGYGYTLSVVVMPFSRRWISEVW